MSQPPKVHAHTTQGGVQRIPGVKNIIAVSSAKGGVGKSTVAVNLALALARQGAATGLLDADIHGPSLPVMLAITDRPQGGANGGIIPIAAHGLQLMSIGFLVQQDQPMAWRGPMATRALTQLLRDTQWQNLDYLIIDMPPGTGDIQLTLAQQIPVTGAVIVTTPQALAVADAKRGIVMFAKVSIPVIGIVENMSIHTCPHCQHASPLFGSGGAQQLCTEHDTELLAQLPIDPALSTAPLPPLPPQSPATPLFTHIAARVAAILAQKSRDRSAAFPKIVIAD